MKKFEVSKMHWAKRNFIQRWAARVVAKMILKQDSSYQCCGKYNLFSFDVDNKVADIQVPAKQFAHWILREAGYDLRPCDLEEEK